MAITVKVLASDDCYTGPDRVLPRAAKTGEGGPYIDRDIWQQMGGDGPGEYVIELSKRGGAVVEMAYCCPDHVRVLRRKLFCRRWAQRLLAGSGLRLPTEKNPKPLKVRVRARRLKAETPFEQA